MAQRALAALRAISLRSSAVSFAARALPPLRPPRRPSATALGFFLGLLLERLGMPPPNHSGASRVKFTRTRRVVFA